MFKLNFRKIKITNNQWATLSLELLVVFLGVSSGFILNNWREGKQQQKIEQNYIQGFIKDVEDNIEELEKLTLSDSIWLESVRPNMVALSKNEFNTDSVDGMMKKVISISKLEAHSGTYEDITNSGNLNIIRNLELRSGIVDYQISVEAVHFLDDYFYQFFNDYITPFVFSEFDVLRGRIIDESIYKTVSFSNIIAGYFAMVQQRKEAYSELLFKSKHFEKLVKEAASEKH